MIADIASGNTDTADVFFLIAVILAVVAALLSLTAYRTVSDADVRRVSVASYARPIIYLAFACVAFAFLQL